MDTENENEQPISSSASSSNSNSSSNLLVNLPMLPMLQSSSHDDEELEEEEEEHMPLHPPSPPPPPPMSLVSNQQHLAQQQQQLHAAPSEQHQQQQLPIADSPLIFNNNSTPPPSSSSSSSSSSHNHQLHHHNQHSAHHQHQHQQHHHHHYSHYHQEQHSPPPSSTQQQQQASTSTEQSQQQQQQNQQFSIDDEDIAESIDASAIEANVESSEQNSVFVASTSQQHTQYNATLGATNAPHSSSPPALPREEAKHQQRFPNTLQYHYHSSSGGCSQLFSANKNCPNMFNSESDKTGEAHTSKSQQTVDRLKILYPNVNEDETPLPRCWSAHDKCLAIGLSNNNLRVRFKGKGAGKHNNDAASVRTAHPIPAACGLYYFEVKIISKGKNGYMGIGLTAQQFRMNRLPGWDKQSYGYHGDDGNSFSSSGNGQSYGPTFTTGDIIGCCVNFKHNLCFYTKNGIHLGTAFRDLPSKLYPTVGLQTPGEEVDANFGQEPFKYDQIEDLMKQMRADTISYINKFPLPVDQQTPMGDPTALLHKLVSSYLVHNGYSNTAEAFARTTGQSLSEDLSFIQNRQKIMKLVMSGKMGQAIEHTLISYPGVFENNKNLLFMLKCRQFIEMVNGSDVEFCPANNCDNSTTNAAYTNTNSSTQTTPPNQTSVIQSTKSYQNGNSSAPTTNNVLTNTNPTTVISADDTQPDLKNLLTDENNAARAGEASNIQPDEVVVHNYFNDVEMENGHNTNGKLCKNGKSNIILNNILDLDEDMDVDLSPSSSRNHSNGFERILEFGKELSQMGQLLEKENKMTNEDRQMLEDAFSLIAYSNPWASPLGWQLCPSKREAVCSALNSAILESMNQPWRPPLEVCVAHASELLKVMARSWLGAGGFVNIESVFTHN